MSFLLQLIEEYGLAAVFMNVLVEQAGAPVPAYPTLVLTGALAGDGKYSMTTLLAVAVIASLIADAAWFLAGRAFGTRVIGVLCRISLSPDSCVRQTESIFARWGAPSLLVAKFVPGFGSVASALAGATGMRLSGFVLFDAIGAALWAGSAIYIGSLFSSTVEDLLAVLEHLGKGGLLLIAVMLAVFVFVKWWQRHAFLHSLRLARISVDELHELMQQENRPLIIDVRPSLQQKEGRIPGALSADEDVSRIAGLNAYGDEVVLYCACPDEASAARLARQLMKRGFRSVRPLSGGIDAWRAAGYAVEAHMH